MDKSLGRRPDQPRANSQMWLEGGSVLEQVGSVLEQVGSVLEQVGDSPRDRCQERCMHSLAPEALQVLLLLIESMEARGKLA